MNHGEGTSTGETTSGRKSSASCSKGQYQMSSSIRLQRNQAEKQRRDRLNGYISELANLVPMVRNASKPLDKVSILRLSAAQMRLNFSCLNPKRFKGKIVSLPSSLTSYLDLIEKTVGGFIIVTTFSGMIVFCSKCIEDYVGYQNIDVMGNSIYSYIHSGDLSYFEKKVNAVISKQKKGRYKKTKVIKAHMQQRPLPRTNDIRYRKMIFKLSVYVNGSSDAAASADAPRAGRVKKTGRLKDFGTSAVMLIFVEPVKLEPEIDISYIEAHQDAYFTMHGLQGEIIYADQRISAITGYMPHDVQGTSAYKYICSSDVPIALFAQKAMFTSSDGTGVITYRLRISDMRYIYLQSSGQIAYKNSSSEISHFVCFNKLLSEEEGSQELKKFQQRFAPQIMAAKMNTKQHSQNGPVDASLEETLSLLNNSLTSPGDCQTLKSSQNVETQVDTSAETSAQNMVNGNLTFEEPFGCNGMTAPSHLINGCPTNNPLADFGSLNGASSNSSLCSESYRSTEEAESAKSSSVQSSDFTLSPLSEKCVTGAYELVNEVNVSHYSAATTVLPQNGVHCFSDPFKLSVSRDVENAINSAYSEDADRKRLQKGAASFYIDQSFGVRCQNTGNVDNYSRSTIGYSAESVIGDDCLQKRPLPSSSNNMSSCHQVYACAEMKDIEYSVETRSKNVVDIDGNITNGGHLLLNSTGNLDFRRRSSHQNIMGANSMNNHSININKGQTSEFLQLEDISLFPELLDPTNNSNLNGFVTKFTGNAPSSAEINNEFCNGVDSYDIRVPNDANFIDFSKCDDTSYNSKTNLHAYPSVSAHNFHDFPQLNGASTSAVQEWGALQSSCSVFNDVGDILSLDAANKKQIKRKRPEISADSFSTQRNGFVNSKCRATMAVSQDNLTLSECAEDENLQSFHGSQSVGVFPASEPNAVDTTLNKELYYELDLFFQNLPETQCVGEPDVVNGGISSEFRATDSGYSQSNISISGNKKTFQRQEC